MGAEKTLKQARAGSRNLRFVDACRLAEAFGFRSTRIKGSHHIYSHPTIPELVNLQSVNGTAKPYQIRQLLDLVERYNLKPEGEP